MRDISWIIFLVMLFCMIGVFVCMAILFIIGSGYAYILLFLSTVSFWFIGMSEELGI